MGERGHTTDISKPYNPPAGSRGAEIVAAAKSRSSRLQSQAEAKAKTQSEATKKFVAKKGKILTSLASARLSDPSRKLTYSDYQRLKASGEIKTVAEFLQSSAGLNVIKKDGKSYILTDSKTLVPATQQGLQSYAQAQNLERDPETNFPIIRRTIKSTKATKDTVETIAPSATAVQKAQARLSLMAEAKGKERIRLKRPDGKVVWVERRDIPLFYKNYYPGEPVPSKFITSIKPPQKQRGITKRYDSVRDTLAFFDRTVSPTIKSIPESTLLSSVDKDLKYVKQEIWDRPKKAYIQTTDKAIADWVTPTRLDYEKQLKQLEKDIAFGVDERKNIKGVYAGIKKDSDILGLKARRTAITYFGMPTQAVSEIAIKEAAPLAITSFAGGWGASTLFGSLPQHGVKGLAVKGIGTLALGAYGVKTLKDIESAEGSYEKSKTITRAAISTAGFIYGSSKAPKPEPRLAKSPKIKKIKELKLFESPKKYSQRLIREGELGGVVRTKLREGLVGEYSTFELKGVRGGTRALSREKPIIYIDKSLKGAKFKATLAHELLHHEAYLGRLKVGELDKLLSLKFSAKTKYLYSDLIRKKPIKLFGTKLFKKTYSEPFSKKISLKLQKKLGMVGIESIKETSFATKGYKKDWLKLSKYPTLEKEVFAAHRKGLPGLTEERLAGFMGTKFAKKGFQFGRSYDVQYGKGGTPYAIIKGREPARIAAFEVKRLMRTPEGVKQTRLNLKTGKFTEKLLLDMPVEKLGATGLKFKFKVGVLAPIKIQKLGVSKSLFGKVKIKRIGKPKKLDLLMSGKVITKDVGSVKGIFGKADYFFSSEVVGKKGIKFQKGTSIIQKGKLKDPFIYAKGIERQYRPIKPIKGKKYIAVRDLKLEDIERTSGIFKEVKELQFKFGERGEGKAIYKLNLPESTELTAGKILSVSKRRYITKADIVQVAKFIPGAEFKPFKVFSATGKKSSSQYLKQMYSTVQIKKDTARSISGVVAKTLPVSVKAHLPTTTKPLGVKTSSLITTAPIYQQQFYQRADSDIFGGKITSSSRTKVFTMDMSISKLMPKVLSKELTKTLPKSMVKTLPKTISKTIPKTTPKTIPKTMPKTLTKSMIKTLTKTTPKAMPKTLTKSPPTVMPPPGLFKFDLEGKGARKQRTARTRDSFAFTPSFSAKALGLGAVSLTEKQASKLLKTRVTGLGIRRGVKIVKKKKKKKKKGGLFL